MATISQICHTFEKNQTPEQLKKDIENLESLLLSEGALNYEISDEEIENSPIRNYFKGKTIFLTGGLGFLGQLLMEKLLRCEVKHIYLLARAKKDKTPQERLDAIFSEIQFCKLQLFYPNFRQHISIIEGNMSLNTIGIKDTDLTLLEETVEIVLHAAADVRFNNRIYDLVITNLRGTRELLKMAERFKKLQIFHYISTAYSNCSQGKTIKEQFYAPPIDPEVMIAYAERITDNSLEQDRLEYITDRLIGKWPNTYTFSKCMSEELVRRSGKKFPICVSRPSIVISTNREPIPGWINNIYGLTGIVTAIGLGLCRSLLLDRKKNINVICADFVINAILATTWSAHLDEVEQRAKLQVKKDETWNVVSTIAADVEAEVEVNVKDPTVYNIVCMNLLTAGKIMKLMLDIYTKYPLRRVIWVQCTNLTNSKLLFTYLSWYYHLVASIIIDLGLKIARRKERLLPYTCKAQVFLKALAYFMQNEWNFENANLQQVLERMHPTDQKLFVCDTRLFDYGKWCYTYLQGAKIFIGKDDLKHQKVATRNYKRLQLLHYVVRMIFYMSQLLLVYLLARRLGLFDLVQNTLVRSKY